MAFALTTGFVAITNDVQAGIGKPALLQGAAAVYLIVRALDNIAQGHRIAIEAVDSQITSESPPSREEV